MKALFYFLIVMLFLGPLTFGCVQINKEQDEDIALLNKIGTLRSGDILPGDVEKALKSGLMESTPHYTSFRYKAKYAQTAGGGCANYFPEYWITVDNEGKILTIKRTQ